MDPREKVALVTGGGVRVGRAISLGLARSGAHVIVHYNQSSGPADETVAEARRLGVEALAVQCDLSRPESATAVVEAAEAAFGGVDILVHSASPFLKGAHIMCRRVQCFGMIPRFEVHLSQTKEWLDV